jgi:hypothetical protein
MDISVGAPEVISRRLQLMQPHTLWSPANLLEVQRMVAEKMMALAESNWAIWRAAWAMAAWPLAGTSAWWTPTHQQRMARHALRATDRALAPLSRRVNANVKRLRRK